MQLPASRPLDGRRIAARILLIGMVALAAFPTFSIGDTPQVQLRTELQFISRNFSEQVSGIQGNLGNQLRLVPSVINEGSVFNQIELIGTLGYNPLRAHDAEYKNALTNAQGQIAMAGINPDDPQFLRGLGACTDRAVEQWPWNAPTAFDKGLAMTLRRPRLNVEYFDGNTNDFVLVPLTLSSQVFPNPKDRLIFTTPNFSGGNRVRVAGIFGGSYTRLNENDANTTACVFGSSVAGANIDVTAEGLNGPFNDSTTADSGGNWDLCLTGLNYGYYKFTATDGTRSDEAEQGFLRKLNFTF